MSGKNQGLGMPLVVYAMYRGRFPPPGGDIEEKHPPFSITDRQGRTITIRVYGEGPVDDEYAAIIDMYHTFDQRHRSLGIPPTTKSRIERWQSQMLADYCVLAWHKNRVAGQAVLVADSDRGYEFAIFLHQDYHGAGIGTELTIGMLSYGKSVGVTEVHLLVEGRNQPAVNLYRDVGFAIIAEGAGDIEMGLTLYEPATAPTP